MKTLHGNATIDDVCAMFARLSAKFEDKDTQAADMYARDAQSFKGKRIEFLHYSDIRYINNLLSQGA